MPQVILTGNEFLRLSSLGKNASGFFVIAENCNITVYRIQVWSVINADGFVSVIFRQLDLINMCKNGAIVIIDGTFKRIPALIGARRLLTFMIEVYEKVIIFSSITFTHEYAFCVENLPLIFCLLTS